MKERETVSLCMIVKNDEEYLEKCLNSVKTIVDEIVIVDTGSTDNTINVASKFNAKIINYIWNNDFSEARNRALKEASKDWILIMDADEVFEKEDINKFLGIINEKEKECYYFDILSYVDENSDFDYIYSSNIRLIKNIEEYEFKGPVCPQITNKVEKTDYSKFGIEDIRVYHYGYLKVNNRKRIRNIDILDNMLIKYPSNAFLNYNLANEYLMIKEYEKSLKFLYISYNNINLNSSYWSNLIIRMIFVLIELKDYSSATKYIEEGLIKNPEYTDLYFFKSLVLKKKKKYTLAIKSLNKCIQLGKMPKELRFLKGCEDYKSYCILGEIYSELQDYEEALRNYEKAMVINKKDIKLYYKLGFLAKRIFYDKKIVSDYLLSFLDIGDVKDNILLAKVLTEISIYDYAMKYLYIAYKKEISCQVIMDIAKVSLYQNNYSKALEFLDKICTKSEYKLEAIFNTILIKIILGNKITEEDINLIEDKNKKIALNIIYKLHINEKIESISKNSEEVLVEIINILEVFIKAKEFDLFEKLVPSLNYIESNKILLELAKLYKRNGFDKLAKDEVLRSVNELGSIDDDGVNILYH